jgi:hypothetical protein
VLVLASVLQVLFRPVAMVVPDYQLVAGVFARLQLSYDRTRSCACMHACVSCTRVGHGDGWFQH